MADSYSEEVKTLLQSYIDDDQNVEKLKTSLKSYSAASRYRLLMDIRGMRYASLSGVWNAAGLKDLEMIQLMLSGFTGDQLHDVVSIEDGYKETTLHEAAYSGSIDIVNYILDRVPQHLRFSLIKKQTIAQNTAVHLAAQEKHLDVVSAIIKHLSLPELVEVMKIKNIHKKTVRDMVPADVYARWIAEGW